MYENKEKYFLTAFGEHLFKERVKQKISRVQLAFEIGTTEKHLRLIEKGEISTGLLNLYKIAKALNIKINKLFEFDYEID
jgi:transcriptional regulator with XRE-family HTH domain